MVRDITEELEEFGKEKAQELWSAGDTPTVADMGEFLSHCVVKYMQEELGLTGGENTNANMKSRLVGVHNPFADLNEILYIERVLESRGYKLYACSHCKGTTGEAHTFFTDKENATSCPFCGSHQYLQECE